VIRRHPDIKWLRKADDIEKLTLLQQQILKNIWSLLKPGGTLLYATCSILPEENIQQIQQFLSENNNAKLVQITNEKTDIGWQILPNEQSMDGFYYAKLEKVTA
jgi:16S rRNA (cytosine967-C5)-methyltransferase